MKWLLSTVVFASALSLSAKAQNPQPSTPSLPTVPYVDIARYMGTWYQIAYFPTSFQKQCGATRVHYRLNDNGKVSVTNQCQLLKDPSRIDTAHGTARVADTLSYAKLKVSFVPLFQAWGWFSGDYWIIDLAPDYTYAVIGTPDREYLWIISRTPELDERLYVDILDRVQELGFDVSRLIETPAWPSEYSTPQ